MTTLLQALKGTLKKGSCVLQIDAWRRDMVVKWFDMFCMVCLYCNGELWGWLLGVHKFEAEGFQVFRLEQSKCENLSTLANVRYGSYFIEGKKKIVTK